MKILILIRDLRIGSGISTCIMNYYPYTISKGIHIDFLMNRSIPSSYMDMVTSSGSNIFVLPKDTNKPNLANVIYIHNTIKNGNYDILHVNLSGWNGLISLCLASLYSIKKRLYHTHTPKEIISIKAKLRTLIYGTPSLWFANSYLACSLMAGRSYFGKRRFKVLPNAFDTSKFVFKEGSREQIRNELKIKDNFVIGVVGRFSPQKNPLFVIEILSEAIKLKPDSIVLWAGDGELKELVKKKVEECGLDNNFILLGNRNDVNELYSAMDVFLLPSLFEGLGIVYVEAMISGLPTFGPDILPEELNFSPLMHRLSLKESPKVWAQAIVNAKTIDRSKAYLYGEHSCFEIKNTSNLLREYYEGID